MNMFNTVAGRDPAQPEMDETYKTRMKHTPTGSRFGSRRVKFALVDDCKP